VAGFPSPRSYTPFSLSVGLCVCVLSLSVCMYAWIAVGVCACLYLCLSPHRCLDVPHKSWLKTWLRPWRKRKVGGPIAWSIGYYTEQTRTWVNAQRDGRPAEYRWRPLFNAAACLTSTTRVPCSNAAKSRNPLKLHGVPQTNKTISAACGPKFTILWGLVEEILLLKIFFWLSIHALVAKI